MRACGGNAAGFSGGLGTFNFRVWHNQCASRLKGVQHPYRADLTDDRAVRLAQYHMRLEVPYLHLVVPRLQLRQSAIPTRYCGCIAFAVTACFAPQRKVGVVGSLGPAEAKLGAVAQAAATAGRYHQARTWVLITLKSTSAACLQSQLSWPESSAITRHDANGMAWHALTGSCFAA